jgi:hypothetical protein
MPQSVSQSPYGDRSRPDSGAALPTLAQARAEGAKRLAEALGLLTADRERLRAAVATAGQPPAVAASLLGLAGDAAIAAASATLHGAPLWDGEGEPSGLGPTSLNETYLAENHALVLEDHPDRLVIGLVDAGAEEVRRGLRFAAGKPVELRTIPFGLWRAARTRAVAAEVDTASLAVGSLDDAERLRDFARDAPVVRYLDGLLERALAERASDIHLEQKADRCLVRIRVDGALRDLEPLAAAFGSGVVARIKVLADLDVASVRAPQDGRATASIRGALTDLRISTTPTVFGESAVVRLLTRHGVDFTVDSLGFDASFRETFGQQLRRPYGLILVTGPTGSGKTTTLYAALSEINRPGPAGRHGGGTLPAGGGAYRGLGPAADAAIVRGLQDATRGDRGRGGGFSGPWHRRRRPAPARGGRLQGLQRRGPGGPRAAGRDIHRRRGHRADDLDRGPDRRHPPSAVRAGRLRHPGSRRPAPRGPRRGVAGGCLPGDVPVRLGL